MANRSRVRKDICIRMIKAMHYVRMTDPKVSDDKLFAELIGTTPARIVDWKNGKGCPTEMNFYILSMKYDLSITWLITGKGEMKEDKPLRELLKKIDRRLSKLSVKGQ